MTNNKPLDLEVMKVIGRQAGRERSGIGTMLVIPEHMWNQAIQEIERLRGEACVIRLTNQQVLDELHKNRYPSIPRCGSCKEFTEYEWEDEWQERYDGWCEIFQAGKNKNNFCSSHPDWKESGKEEK